MSSREGGRIVAPPPVPTSSSSSLSSSVLRRSSPGVGARLLAEINATAQRGGGRAGSVYASTAGSTRAPSPVDFPSPTLSAAPHQQQQQQYQHPRAGRGRGWTEDEIYVQGNGSSAASAAPHAAHIPARATIIAAAAMAAAPLSSKGSPNTNIGFTRYGSRDDERDRARERGRDLLRASPPPPLPSSSAALPAGGRRGGGGSSSQDTRLPLHLARQHALAEIQAKKEAAIEFHVKVGVRARPLSAAELQMGDVEAWVYDPPQGCMSEALNIEGGFDSGAGQGVGGGVGGSSGRMSPAMGREMYFDHVFPPSSSTAEVYEALGRPIVAAALEGYNGTLFAYGQTGSGKTHSLMGNSEEPGVMIHAVNDIFRAIEGTQPGSEFLVRCSYVEIYNEDIRDLFNPSAAQLRIVENPITGPYVKGVTEEVVLSPQRVFELMAIGEANRHVAATNMNYRSSRSHTLFKLIVESKDAGQPGATPNTTGSGGSIVRVSSLHLIDLAGSERVAKSHAEGLALKETGLINASLLTLGVVINKLANGEPHIPYRDSKLTRLLCTSLGGNARTGVLVTLSPATWHAPETRSSLHFALRAMCVVNKARVNEIADEPAIIASYRREIAQLKAALLEHRGGSVITAEGEVVTAEEMLGRVARQGDEKAASLQSEAEAAALAANDAIKRANDFLQLCFVAAHACGHLRSAPAVVETLGEVAVGSMSAGEAVKALIAAVPGFRRRMTRLLPSQHARVLGDVAPVLQELVALASGQIEEGGAAASSSFVRGRKGASTAGGERSSSVLSVGSPAASNDNDGAGGASTYALSRSSLGGGGAANPPPASSPWNPRGSSLGLGSSSALFSPRGGSSLVASMLGLPSFTGGRYPLPITSSWNTAISNFEGGGGEEHKREEAPSGRSDTPSLFANDLAMPVLAVSDVNGAEAASGVNYRPSSVRQMPSFLSVSTVGQLGLGAAASAMGGAGPDGDRTLEYFTPQSFSRQLLSLLAKAESGERLAKEAADALAAKTAEAASASSELASLQSRFQAIEATHADIVSKTAAATELAAADAAALRALREENAALFARATEAEGLHSSLLQEHEEVQMKSAARLTEAAAAIAQLEGQLHEATSNKEKSSANESSLASRAAQAEALILSLRSQVDETAATAAASAAAAALATEQLEAANARSASMALELSTAQTLVFDLRTALNAAEIAVAEATRARAEAETALRNKERSREEAARDSMSARGTAIASEARAATAESESHLLRMRVAELTGEVSALRPTLEGVRAEADRLTSDLEAASLRFLEAEHAKDAAVERTRAVELELAIAKKQVEARDGELRAAGGGANDGVKRSSCASSGAAELRVREAEGRAAALGDAVAELRAAVADRDSAISILQAKLESKRMQLAESNASLEDASARAAAAGKLADERGRRVSALENEAAALRASLATMREEAVALAETRSSVAAAQSAAARELEVRAAEAEAQAGALDTVRAAAEKEVSRLSLELAELQVKYREVFSKEASEVAAHSAAAERLQRSLDVAVAAREAAAARAASLESRVAALQTEASEREGTAVSVSASLSAAIEERDELRGQVSALQMHVTRVTARADEAEQRAAASAGTAASVSAARGAEAQRATAAETRVRSLEARVSTLEGAVATASASAATATRERDDALAHASSAEMRVAELTATLASTIEALTAAREECGLAREMRDAAAAQVETLSHKIRLLEASKMSLEGDVVRLGDQARSAGTDVSVLLGRAEVAEGIASSLRTTVASLRMELEEASNALQSAHAAAAVQTSRAEGAQTKAAALAATSSSLKEELEAAHIEILRLLKESAVSSQRADAAASASAVAVGALAEAEGEVAKLRRAVEEAATTRNARDLEVAQLRAAVAVARSEVEAERVRLSSTVAAAEDKVKAAEARAQVLARHAEVEKMEAVKAAAAEADAEFQRLAAMVAEASARATTAESRLDSAVAAAEARWRDVVATARSEAESAIRSRDRTSAHLAHMEGERNNFASRATALASNVERTSQETSELRAEVETLRAHLFAAKEEVVAATTATQAVSVQEKRRVEAVMEQLATAQKQAEMNASSSADEMSSLRKALADAKARVSDLESSQSLAVKSIAALRKELKQQQTEMNAAKDAALAASTQAASIADERAAALADAALASNELDVSRKRLVSVQKEVGEVRIELARAREEAHAAKLEAASHARASVAAGLASARDEIRVHRTALSAELSIGSGLPSPGGFGPSGAAAGALSVGGSGVGKGTGAAGTLSPIGGMMFSPMGKGNGE